MTNLLTGSVGIPVRNNLFLSHDCPPCGWEHQDQYSCDAVHFYILGFPPDASMSIDMKLPDDLVPDSERATVSVIGNLKKSGTLIN